MYFEQFSPFIIIAFHAWFQNTSFLCQYVDSFPMNYMLKFENTPPIFKNLIRCSHTAKFSMPCMVELQSIVVFHGCHFVRHLEICNRICVKLLQLMWAVIRRNSVRKMKKNDVSISNRFPEVHKCDIHIDIQTHTAIASSRGWPKLAQKWSKISWNIKNNNK